MKLEFRNANSLLINAFPEMKEIFDDNADEYIGLPYAFYEGEFVPYIMSKLRQHNTDDLVRVFDFVEKLFAEGDDMIVNLAGVAIVESLFFENDYSKHRESIFSLCGVETRKSFDGCEL